MSASPDKRVGHYYGEDIFDAMVWDSANILDDERRFQDVSNPGDYVVEWEDDKGRLCRLTSEVVADKEFIALASSNYAYTTYRLKRQDTRKNTVRNYVIFSDVKKIEQRDGQMRMLPKRKQIGRAALIDSILESYDDFSYAMSLDEDEAKTFNEIVYNYRTDTVVRRLGRTIKNLFNA